MRRYTVEKHSSIVLRAVLRYNGMLASPITRVAKQGDRLEFGSGVPLYLDRRLHTTFKELEGREVSFSGTVKLEFENDKLVRAIFFVDNSEILETLISKNAPATKEPIPRRIRLG